MLFQPRVRMDSNVGEGSTQSHVLYRNTVKGQIETGAHSDLEHTALCYRAAAVLFECRLPHRLMHKVRQDALFRASWLKCWSAVLPHAQHEQAIGASCRSTIAIRASSRSSARTLPCGLGS